MIIKRHLRRRGFSLIELTIVLGVVAAIIGAIWSYASSSKQAAHVSQTVTAIASTADSVRAAYGGQANITGGVPGVMPNLIALRAIPSTLLSNINAAYADSPLAQVSNTGGTFRVCAWAYSLTAGDTVCNTALTGPASQFFAIELTNLSYGSCLDIAEQVVPSHPPGLQDVYINGTPTAGTGLPVAPSTAKTACTPVAPNTTSTIDFIYTLRAPAY